MLLLALIGLHPTLYPQDSSPKSGMPRSASSSSSGQFLSPSPAKPSPRRASDVCAAFDIVLDCIYDRHYVSNVYVLRLNLVEFVLNVSLQLGRT